MGPVRILGARRVKLGPIEYDQMWKDERGYQRPVELATVRNMKEDHERGPLELGHLREVIVTARERARHFTAYLRASASLCLFSALDSHIFEQ